MKQNYKLRHLPKLIFFILTFHFSFFSFQLAAQEGLTKNGESTATSDNFINKNGKLSSSPEVDKYGKNLISSVPTITNTTTGKIWMDRNLGATQVANSSTDTDSYGDLYQWGRLADGHESRTSGTTTTLSSSDTPSHANFIITAVNPHDWRSPKNDNLWQGVSSPNNPCPNGFRLPTEAEWEAERASWSSDNSAGAFASVLKLTLTGYRSGATLYSAGTLGYYWSSTVDGTKSKDMGISSGGAGTISTLRSVGLSVRCIKD